MSKGANICRSITFCSNHIPANTIDQEWEYMSIGTIDGIMISDNLIKSGGSITNCIWEEQKRFQQSLKGEFTAQQVFVVRYGNEIAEQKFWSMDKGYPFYFFCFCQFMGDKKVLWSNKERAEKYLEKEFGLKIITYLTYDNTDLFIVLKTREYNVGAAVINKLHQMDNLSIESANGVCLKNSYTVFAMNRSWLNDLTAESKNLLNNQRIGNVLISIMENREGDLGKVEKVISETLKVEKHFTPILGESDDMIILEDVGWGDFLEMYVKMFVKRDNFYESGAVASISTLLVTRLDGGMRFLNENGIIKDNTIKNNNGIQDKEDREKEANKEKYLSKIKEMKSQYGIDTDGKHGELNIILNALPKFTGEVFNDYMFYSLLKPIEALLTLTNKCGKNGNYNKEYYYDFINCLYLYIQTSNMSDKHTVQGLGFNSKIYDVPIKISAFYNAYLHKMTEILNIGNTCEYVFLTVPGMQFNVNVNELYPNVSEEKRLILIKIPEHSFYGIHEMMNILGHETAHYVGRKFRNRRDRLFSFVKSYVHLFVKYMHYMYMAYFNADYLKEDIVEDIERRIFDLVILRLEERRLFFKEENKSGVKVSMYYFAVLIPNIVYVMEKLIENDFELALSSIGKEIEDKAQAIQVISNFREIAERFMHECNSRSTLVDSQSVLEMFHSLYEECFADIMSVLILGTSLEDYISCIVNEAKEQGMGLKKFERTEAMFRIGTVILCLCNSADTSNGWTEEFDLNSSKPWVKIAENAISTCYSEESAYNDKFEKDVYAFVASKTIFEELYSYLKQCIADFEKYKKEPDMKKKLADIQNTYHTFAKKRAFNAEEQIAEISKVIEEYKDYFWDNI